MKRNALLFSLVLTLAIAIGYMAQSLEPDVTPHRLAPDGTLGELPRTPQFIRVDMKIRPLPEHDLVLYHGVATWTKEAGDKGRPAVVPILLVLPIPESKELLQIATYYTSEDGRFWLVAPLGKDYMLMAQTGQASNMPAKALRYFEEQARKEVERVM